MTGKLEDNILLALFLASIIAGGIHYFRRNKYITNSIYSSIIATLIWMTVLSIESGSVSNIWPIAMVIWFIMFTPVAFLVGIPMVMFLPKEIPPGHCKNCGYNLTGNVSGICPECGEKI